MTKQRDLKTRLRLSDHLKAVKEKHPEWVGIFLQGSQNYNLDYEGSDVDSKLIVLPSFEDFALNRKPLSYTHIMDNDEHVDVKDIRLMFECFRKQNINFVEILFTKYSILNPKYERLFKPVLEARESIGRYNDFAALNCMVGTAPEKRKALCHPYPATISKIERFGFDPKQLHHILRLQEFMQRWLAGVPYADCLVSEQREYLKSVKAGLHSLDEAVELSERAVQAMQDVKAEYMEAHQATVNQAVDKILNDTLISLLKFSFQCELGDNVDG